VPREVTLIFTTHKNVPNVARQATTPLHYAGDYTVNVGDAPTRQKITEDMSYVKNAMI